MDLEALIETADQEMYKAKKEKKSQKQMETDIHKK